MDQLIAALNANLSVAVQLDQGDVTINHYENLQNQAIEVEGYVDMGSTALAFKALIDLNDPSQTMVFVPTTQDPTDTDLATLDAMNARIVALGGDPMTAEQEPVH